jgi:hypothetical protein
MNNLQNQQENAPFEADFSNLEMDQNLEGELVEGMAAAAEAYNKFNNVV